MGASILDDVSSSALCPPSVLREWGMNPIDCLGGTRSDHIYDDRPMFVSTAHVRVAAGRQVETRPECDELSLPAENGTPAKDHQRCHLDRPARTFVPVPETVIGSRFTSLFSDCK